MKRGRCTDPRGSVRRRLWTHVRALFRRHRSCEWTPPGFPDLPPDSFVREPLRPGPLSGAGAAALPEPNGFA